ncbi:trimeric intracellular cation channel family protein [Flammeovirga agarivorans]|uniref:Trimeric intracellular cation channel family protein n=1 Tax=Flammeovirga agarivorans TaxID=2726742 RepID=A0A7X8SPH5_9BACT|nr:TRIC cation channel family protein [Flammeovirga agarivorans]NLR93989.1 trimeric intracellular cation channel family protein [Flammeovirga agarivorans]
MPTIDFSFIIAMLGTVAFSVTAVLSVLPKKIDIFGAIVLGIITAIGGGTMRDIILGVPVFWGSELSYLWVAIFSSLIAFYGNSIMSKKYIYKLMLYLDGAGISLFVIQGAEKAIQYDFAWPIGPILLGVLTAIGGGITRDIIAGNTTLLMKKELYAVPVTIGAILYVCLVSFFPQYNVIIGISSIIITFLIRSIAIKKRLSVPKWMLTNG